MTVPEAVSVLIVDDESAVTDLYEERLSEFRTYTTNDGAEALARLDRLAEQIDVVLLDRKKPELSSDAVLRAIREREYDCRIAMITSVAPDYDILDTVLDEYVTKPVDGDTLRETVRSLYDRARYKDRLAHYYSLVTKQANLVAERPREELSQNEEFVSLEAEIETVRRTLVGDHREFQHVLREICQ
ncbi:response regulator [Haladaptatus sp. NG-WS-4]